MMAMRTYMRSKRCWPAS